MMRRGPGVLRVAAGTAVVAGTATAVSGRVARRQDQRAYDQAMSQQAQMQQMQAQAAPPPPPPQQAAPQQDVYAEIEKLGKMKDQGLITPDEFAAKKAQLLGL